jgi:hypothetical protein
VLFGLDISGTFGPGREEKKRPARCGAGRILFGDDGVLNPFPLFN